MLNLYHNEFCDPYEIVSPGFIVISSVFTPRAFNSFWKASGVPVRSGNVA